MGDIFTMPDGTPMKSRGARGLAAKADTALRRGSYQQARRAYNRAIRAERAERESR